MKFQRGSYMAAAIKGVRATHKAYDEFAPVWQKCVDVAEGGTRILRQKREDYLPRYHEEGDDEYNARLNRTVLANFSWRTICGYRGMLQRKPAVVTVPPSITPLLADVTLSGMSLSTLIGEVIEEVLITGRTALFVNFPNIGSAATLADALRLNLRPSIHKIEASAVTNWATRRVDNETVLSLVVIQEEHCEPDDEFTSTEQTRYRVLDLFDEIDPLTGFPTVTYRVRVMAYDSENDRDITLEQYFPLMGGQPMRRIPFTFISPDCIGPDVDSPPLADLIDVNLAHWEQTSSYYHGAFWSGLPQPYITGYEPPKGEKLRIGGTVWCLPTIGSKVGMLETGAAGLPTLEKALDRLEHQMVILGSRMLETHSAGAQEGVTTAQVHLSGEHSVLASMGQAISAGLTAAMKVFVAWTGADASSTRIMINDDFFNEPLSPEARLSLVKSWQSFAIGDETLFRKLKDGGDYPPDARFEDEQAKIKNSTAPVAAPSIAAQPLVDQLNPTVQT